jgi:hypothetical protein
MTGGGFGPCGVNSGWRGSGYGARGGGFGRGSGFGRGFGRGWGFRNRRWASDWSGHAQGESPAEPGLIQRLSAEVERLRERIAELEKPE